MAANLNYTVNDINNKLKKIYIEGEPKEGTLDKSIEGLDGRLDNVEGNIDTINLALENKIDNPMQNTHSKDLALFIMANTKEVTTREIVTDATQ